MTTENSSRTSTVPETDSEEYSSVNPATDMIDCKLSRRDFVKTVGYFTGAGALGLQLISVETIVECAPLEFSASAHTVELTVNGLVHKLTMDTRVTLLDALREYLKLTGTKKGCDHGQCGACTVLVNGRRINSCLSLAVTHQGDQITTIEGLSGGEELHPLQTAFIEHDGFQCGYCTPGQICSAVALLEEARRGDASFVTQDLAHTGRVELTPEEIRERMSGNICRCGAYPGIVQAVQTASRTL